MKTERHYAFERDDSGAIVRMVWLGDWPKPDPPPCMFAFTTKSGLEYRCKLADRHKGPHEFV